MDVATTEADVIEAWRLSGLFPVNPSVPLGRPVVTEAQGLAKELAQKRAAKVPISTKGITSIDQIAERMREGSEQRRRGHKRTAMAMATPAASAPAPCATALPTSTPVAAAHVPSTATSAAPSTTLITTHVCSTSPLPGVVAPAALLAAVAPRLLAPSTYSAPAHTRACPTVTTAKRPNPHPKIDEEPPRSVHRK